MSQSEPKVVWKDGHKYVYDDDTISTPDDYFIRELRALRSDIIRIEQKVEEVKHLISNILNLA